MKLKCIKPLSKIELGTVWEAIKMEVEKGIVYTLKSKDREEKVPLELLDEHFVEITNPNSLQDLFATCLVDKEACKSVCKMLEDILSSNEGE